MADGSEWRREMRRRKLLARLYSYGIVQEEELHASLGGNLAPLFEEVNRAILDLELAGLVQDQIQIDGTHVFYMTDKAEQLFETLFIGGGI